MSIIDNRKAFHDYFIEDKYEAGLVLQGWEVKAIRAGRANIKESYVVIRGAEIFIVGIPLPSPWLLPAAVGVQVLFVLGQAYYLLTARPVNAYS